MKHSTMIVIGILAVVLVFTLIASAMYIIPRYSVWQQGMTGRAELVRADQNRQIKVREAQATKEAAALLAEAEIERARGVAEANKIIGDSLKGNEDYLRYLWIHNLESAESHGSTIIYVPTEANLPILEAARMRAERD